MAIRQYRDSYLLNFEMISKMVAKAAILDICKPYVGLNQSLAGSQSELPWPILRNSTESNHGCTSRTYFENAGDNVALTLYNVTLMSQILCSHNNKCDCCKTNGLNEVDVFFLNKIPLYCIVIFY